VAIVFNGNAATGVQSACIGPPSQGVIGAEYPSAVLQTGGTTTAQTFSTAIQQGDAIVVCIALYGASATITSVSDGTNTYALLESESATTAPATAVYGCISIVPFAASGLTVTVTFGTLPTSSTLCLARYTGPGGCGFFDANVNDATGTTGGTSVSLATQFFCEMLVNFAAGDAVGTAAVAGSGFTGHQASPGSGLGFSYLLQDQLLTAPATTSATATGIASAHWSTISIGVVAYCGPANVLPSSGCCFVYVPSGGSALNSAICELDGSTNSPRLYLESNSLKPELVSDGEVQGTAMTTGTWWFVCWRISGNGVGADGSQVGRMPIGGSEILWATLFSDGTAAFLGAEVCFGILNTLGSGNTQATQSQAAELSIAGAKIWSNNDPNVSAWLTDADFIKESRQVEPVRTADLWAYWSFAGNGATGQLVAEQGIAAGMTLVPFSSAQISFGQDPQIPRYRARRFSRRGFSASAVALAIAIVGQATMADAILVARKLTAAIVGGATMAAALKVARTYADSIGGSATVVDAMAVKRALTVTDTGHATIVDAVTVKRALADAIAGDASVTSAVKLARTLLESVSGLSGMTSSASVARAMLAAIEGAATDAFSLARSRPLSGAFFGVATSAQRVIAARHLTLTAIGQASMVSSFVGARPLKLAGSGVAALSAAAIVARPLNLAAHGVADLSVSLAVARPLATSFHATSILSAKLAMSRAMSLSVDATVAMAASVRAARTLSLSVDALAILTADLTVQSAGQKLLQIDVAGHATATDAIAVKRFMASSVDASAILGAILGVRRPMSDSVAGRASLATALTTLRPLVLPVHGVATASFAASWRRGLILPLAGASHITSAILRAATIALDAAGSGSLTAELGKAFLLAVEIDAIASLISALTIGNGPIGPLRIASSDFPILTFALSDAEIVTTATTDARITSNERTDAGPIVIDQADGAIVTITTTDGPPT
jgi:hypothetical protein